MAVDGIGLGLIAGGSLLAYAGVKGLSIPSALEKLVQGQNPSTAAKANQINTSAAASGNAIYTTQGTVGDVSAGASQQSYFTAVLKDLSAPVTAANLTAFDRWYAKEEPSWPPPTPWTWNPLNIKGNGPDGFASYSSPQSGAFATAGFMLSNGYSAIIASLRTGNGIVDSAAVAGELSSWSGGGYTSVNSGGG